MIKQIEVGNLPTGTTESQVKKLFTDYGQVTKILIKDSRLGLTAYVDLSSDMEANAALGGLANAKMGLNSLNVNEARPRTD